jgi:hypothetical protein
MNLYGLLADLILIVHALFVAFVVCGLGVILLGLWRRWAWVRNFWFRVTHLAAIGIVVAQAWAGVLCPLTVWENALRRQAGEEGYPGSFIGHWLQRILYWQAEEWIFTAVYTAFGLLVMLTWLLGRPLPRRPD